MKQSDISKFAEMAKTMASFSKADRLHVGSLIIKDGRVISSGYNGHLPGKKHEAIMCGGHDISTIHSEQNSLMNCARLGISTKDCELFVTHFPCQLCTKLAIMAGIKKIYYLEDYRNEDNPFFNDIEIVKVKNS